MKQQSKTIQKKAFIGILCSVILIFLDQFTKYLAVQHLKDQMPVVLWKNVLELISLKIILGMADITDTVKNLFICQLAVDISISNLF